MAQTPETKEYDNARGNLLASPGGHRADDPEWIDHDGERHSLCAHHVAPALILDPVAIVELLFRRDPQEGDGVLHTGKALL